MKNTTKLILFILTALVLFLPMAQEHFKLFKFRSLTGVVAEAPQPEVTFSNYTNRSLQQWTESHLKLNYGLREPLTRFYNQYMWDFYRHSNLLEKNPEKDNTKKMYMDDDGWLVETPYVEEYYAGKGRWFANDSLGMANYFSQEAFRLYQLQKILEKEGTRLFVLLLPGKELIYPEHVPETDDFPKDKVFSLWKYYGIKFKEMGINHVDVGQWFLEMKDTVDYPLFPQTGTHWSNYAVLHVADSLIRYMEQLGDIKMQHFTIGEREERTVNPDDDLEQLMNLARPLPKTPNYYASYTIIEDSTAYKPMHITIGDSYYWNLLNATPFGKVMERIRYWYYYNSVYFDFDYGHKNIQEVDVMKEVLDADFVMLAYSTAQLYQMSQGFSQQLLVELCCDEEDLATATQELAASLNISDEEARKVVMKNPNRYIPALRDSIPTKRSQKFMQYHGIQQ